MDVHGTRLARTQRPHSAIFSRLRYAGGMSVVRHIHANGRFSNRASGSSSEPHSVSKWDHTHAGHASLRSRLLQGRCMHVSDRSR